MGVHDDKFQTSILNTIEEQALIDSIILQDIINEHLERKTIMENLDLRARRESADNWKEDRLSKDFTGVPIFDRTFTDELKVNHRIHNDFFNRIANTFTGYMGNEINIKWDEREIAENIMIESQKKIAEFNTENTMQAVYQELLDYDVKEGTAYLLLYNSEAELKVKELKPWECVIIKNATTGETEYAMRYWKAEVRTVNIDGSISKDTKTVIEWYDREKVTHYIGTTGKYEKDELNYPAESIQGLDGKTYQSKPAERLHFMGAVPIVEFPKNKERIGDCEKSLELQDAYDITLSDLSAEVAQLRLSYLLLKALGRNIDSEFLEQLKQTGIIPTDENGEAKFVEKNLNSDAVHKLMKEIKENIYLFSNSVDFSSEEFSGNMPIIAFKLKTKPLEESAKQTEIYMKKALREMYKIVANFWKLRDNFELPIDVMDFVFTRNLPINTTEEIDNTAKLKGMVDEKTRLSLLSFIEDPEETIDRMNKEKEENIQEFYDMEKNREDQNKDDKNINDQE